jgi:hypothetical protein
MGAKTKSSAAALLNSVRQQTSVSRHNLVHISNMLAASTAPRLLLRIAAEKTTARDRKWQLTK